MEKLLVYQQERFDRSKVRGICLLSVNARSPDVRRIENPLSTIYRDVYGNYYKERDDGSGCLVAAFMVAVVLVLSPFLLLLNCLCNFIRNYVTSR